MMKRILCALLAVCCMLALTACGCRHKTWNEATCETPKTCAECGEVEGEALGHSWQDATCEAPKTCANCGLTEGEALGHNWQDATTEAPMTCSNCAATEGERIVTDPRFTTAATAEVQGVWTTELRLGGDVMGLPEFEDEMVLIMTLELGNDGTMNLYGSIQDGEAYLQALIEYTIEMIYTELEAQGIDRATTDATMQETYGMSVREYAEASLAGIDLDALAESMTQTLVYYVEDGTLYSAATWEDEMLSSWITVSGDTLTMEGGLGGDEDVTIYTRVNQ